MTVRCKVASCTFCTLFGAGTLIFGIAIVALLPTLVRQTIEKTVPLTPTGETGKNWLDPPYDITVEFYVFNLTNGVEWVTTGQKPVLQQKGPYVYRELQQKYDAAWLANNTIYYWNKKTYIWADDLTKIRCPSCSQSDVISLPNVPLLSVIQLILEYFHNTDPAVQAVVNGLEFGSQTSLPVVSSSVGQLIFEGYWDPLLNLTQFFLPPDFFQPINKSRANFPKKMGFFYGKNATNDSSYIIGTGVNSVGNVGKILDWAGSGQLPRPWWSNSWSRMINGTDGSLYPPFVKKTDRPQLFISDICRSVYLTYLEDIAHGGIPGYRFVLPSWIFNSSLPENTGFCSNSFTSNVNYYASSNLPYKKGCMPAGLLDISQCQTGNPPVVVSQPHFLYCPNEVINSIEGMNPIENQMRTVVDIEPTTGVVLMANRRLQLNVAVQNSPTQFTNVNSTIIPAIWLNETAVLNQTAINLLKSQVVTQQMIAKTVGYLLIAIGIGIILLSLFSIIIVLNKNKSKIASEKSSVQYKVDRAQIASRTSEKYQKSEIVY